jgi:hypothetical protein
MSDLSGFRVTNIAASGRSGFRLPSLLAAFSATLRTALDGLLSYLTVVRFRRLLTNLTVHRFQRV